MPPTTTARAGPLRSGLAIGVPVPRSTTLAIVLSLAGAVRRQGAAGVVAPTLTAMAAATAPTKPTVCDTLSPVRVTANLARKV